MGSGTVTKEDEYRNLYSEADATAAQIRGDYSIGSLVFHQHSIPRIKSLLEEPKIVLILREPIQRAFSSYLLHLKTGIEELDFKDAISVEVERRRAEEGLWFGFQHRSISKYSAGVESFLKEFSEVKVIIFEDFFGNLEAGVTELFDFLELDYDVAKLSSPSKENSSLVPYSPTLSKVVNALGRQVPFARSFLTKIDNMQKYRPDLPEELVAELVGYFRDDVKKLEDVIKRDLTVWSPFS